MQCIPAFVEMLPDKFALNRLLDACKCTSAQTTDKRLPDWELRAMEKAKASLAEALTPCMETLVEKAKYEPAAVQVLAEVQAVSPEFLVPYAEDITKYVSLFELAPKLPYDVRMKFAPRFVLAAVGQTQVRTHPPHC